MGGAAPSLARSFGSAAGPRVLAEVTEEGAEDRYRGAGEKSSDVQERQRCAQPPWSQGVGAVFRGSGHGSCGLCVGVYGGSGSEWSRISGCSEVLHRGDGSMGCADGVLLYHGYFGDGHTCRQVRLEAEERSSIRRLGSRFPTWQPTQGSEVASSRVLHNEGKELSTTGPEEKSVMGEGDPNLMLIQKIDTKKGGKGDAEHNDKRAPGRERPSANLEGNRGHSRQIVVACCQCLTVARCQRFVLTVRHQEGSGQVRISVDNTLAAHAVKPRNGACM
ncbi:hypothetical protein Esti_006058 [Eimeria stiedai]